MKIEDANFEKSSLREDLDLNDKIIFLYGGNIGVAQDLDNILNLAKNLLDQKDFPGFRFSQPPKIIRQLKIRKAGEGHYSTTPIK